MQMCFGFEVRITQVNKAFSFPKLYEPPGEHANLMHCDNVSKTNQGGLSSCKRKPKEICQSAIASSLYKWIGCFNLRVVTLAAWFT